MIRRIFIGVAFAVLFEAVAAAVVLAALSPELQHICAAFETVAHALEGAR